MELPHLGKHCSEELCRKLDFLPVKCDGCGKTFCGEHYKYASHDCPNAYKKDVQVPVCPLCSAPVPGNLEELPDIRVNRHIDNDCKSDTASSRRNKVYTNKCAFKGCKQKEMIPVICDTCKLNFCLKHRHPQDHSCSKVNERRLGRPGEAALARIQEQQKSSTSDKKQVSTASKVQSTITSYLSKVSSAGNTSSSARVQGNLSEEEALQLALQASMSETSITSNAAATAVSPSLSQEQADFMLAKAIADSEREQAVVGGESSRSHRRSQSNCKIS